MAHKKNNKFNQLSRMYLRICLVIFCSLFLSAPKADANFTVLSSNADLSALAVSCGTLSPAFNAAVTSYTVSVSNSTRSIIVAPTVADAAVSSVTVGSGQNNYTVLVVGINIVNVVIIAEDGKTARTYTIKVIRAASDNADLSALALSTGTITPYFASSTNSYALSVGTATSSITVIPTLADTNANVKVNEKTISNGNKSDSIALSIGKNLITVWVTAQDGITIKSYLVTVTRSAPVEVPRIPQVITFSAFDAKTYGDQQFILQASADSGLPISYSSDNSGVAQVRNGYLYITGAGTAAITASQSGEHTYNAANPVTQVLTVNKAVITITANNKTKTEGQGDPILDFTCSGFVNSEKANILAIQPAIAISAAKNSSAGIYPITVSGGKADNYTLKYVEGALTVIPAVLPNRAPTLAEVSNQAICYTTAKQTILLNGISSGSVLEQTTNFNVAGSPAETGQNIILSISSSNGGMIRDLDITRTGSTGIISYVPANIKGGSVIITVKLKDDGGTDNGGVDTLIRKFTITINPVPVISINSDRGTTIVKGTQATLTASGGVGYKWSDAAGILYGQNGAAITVAPLTTTTYTVTVTNASGCADTKSITLNVLEDYKPLDINNVLTPNGDGKNDKLVIKNLNLYPNNFIRIMDRVGREVYKMKNYNNEWDGTCNGRPLLEDTYYYIVDLGQGTKPVKGFVSIINN